MNDFRLNAFYLILNWFIIAAARRGCPMINRDKPQPSSSELWGDCQETRLFPAASCLP